MDDYQGLVRAIRDFEGGMNYFNNSNSEGSSVSDDLNARTEQYRKTPSRLDARVRGMEYKIDSQSSKLADLTLLVNKGRSSGIGEGSGERERGRDWTCWYCHKYGHNANRRPENPHGDKRCPECGKIGHSEKVCW